MVIRLIPDRNSEVTAKQRIEEFQGMLRRTDRQIRDEAVELVQSITDEVTAAARALGIEAETSQALQAKVNYEIRSSAFNSYEHEMTFEAVCHDNKEAPRDPAWSRYAVLRCMRLLLEECHDPGETWLGGQCVGDGWVVPPGRLDFTAELLDLLHEQLPIVEAAAG